MRLKQWKLFLQKKESNIMDEIRYRFAANDKNLLWRRFKAILVDWSDEIENPSVDWCLRDKNLVLISEKLSSVFNDMVYFEDDSEHVGVEFSPFLKLSVDFSVLELVDRRSENELSDCKVELTFNFNDLNHEITYQLVKTMNVKLKKVKAGYR